MSDKVWNLIDSQTLVWGSEWDDAKSTIRAVVFGKMVELGRTRIQHYRSDLFHDALWLNEQLTGPMQFDWIARTSGTFIGDIVSSVKDDDYEDSARYRFEIIKADDRKWMLNIYEAGPIKTDTISWADRHAALDISECDVATAIEGCIFHPAPVGGWNKEEKNEEEFILSDEFKPYFSNEVLPDAVADILYGSDEPDKQTLADAEDALKALDPINEIIESLFDRPVYKAEEISVIGDFNSPYDFPTLRNDSNEKPSASIRKENGMDSIIRDLREKAQDAENAKEELDGFRYELDSAIDELDEYINSVNELIDNLDNLPEVSVSVELEVSFDS